MKSRIQTVLLLLLLLPFTAVAASEPAPAPPGSDIWLVDLSDSGGSLKVSNARNLTERPGYDNQPAFLSPSTFLFTAMDESGQTDAWLYDLENDSARVVVETPQSEYSPTPVPGGGISAVRVARDGTQQLWRLRERSDEYELLFPLIEGVGYHAWLDGEHIALFLVREPAELHIANRRTGEVLVLAKSVGRSLHAVPGKPGTLAFIEPGEDGAPWIKRYDMAGKRISAIAPAVQGSQDFAFTPDGRLLMAQDRDLRAWSGSEWQTIAKLDSLPGSITRLAVSPDARHAAIVVSEGN